MPTQREAGKALEFALINELHQNLTSAKMDVRLTKDSSYFIANRCYKKFTSKKQNEYSIASQVAIDHLHLLEPNLICSNEQTNPIDISIVPDSRGERGDVRDIIVIRNSINWEIGISAKNHHRAVKHSRLSDKINFGKKWLSIPNSVEYLESIKPIFAELRSLRDQKKLWKEIPHKSQTIYKPLLNFFCKELLRIDTVYPKRVPPTLLEYLLGRHDFYKIIKNRGKTVIQAINLRGTLNQSKSNIKPKIHLSRIHLPTRIIEFVFKENSENTLVLTCDKGWQISFRIHNASSRVEPSLKFDINLIGQPESLYSHHLHWH